MKVFVSAPGASPGILDALLQSLEAHDVVLDPAARPLAGRLDALERQAFVESSALMTECDAAVVELSSGDAGAGWVVAWFLARGRLVVVCCDRAGRARLSPLVAGNPSPWQRLVAYEDAPMLATRLGEWFARA